MGQFDAIYRRKSIRKYSDEYVPVGIIEEIKDMVTHGKRLYEDIDMDVHVIENGLKFQEVLPGIIGSYGKVKAPHYIVVTSERKEGYLENIGFTMESIVLELTDMGIGTCWIGGNIDKCLFDDFITMKNNHVPVVIIAFGYPRDENDDVKTIVNSRKRMDISEIFNGNLDDLWYKIMEAVRVAPSAVNIQPWRFFNEDHRIDVYSVKRTLFTNKHLEEMNRIDVGIGLSHLDIAAQYFEKSIELKKLDNVSKKGHYYVTSIFEEI
jgi:nitroreductase